MPLFPNRKRDQNTLALFESLEDRLLLTTLMIPDSGEEQYFVYRDSQSNSIRVSLAGQPGDAVELLAMDYGNYVGDLPGIFAAVGITPSTVVTWAGGDPYDIVSWEEGVPSWANRSTTEGIIGSISEIFAVYVAQASNETVLTFAQLTSNNLQPEAEQVGLFSDLAIWSGTTAYNGDYSFPGNSGEVLIGGEPSVGEEGITYYAASSQDPVWVDARGVFPGGYLRPGITVSQAAYEVANQDTEQGLGNNIQSVAVGPDGTVYTADSGVYASDTFTNENSFGQGLIVNGLAIDSSGTFFSAENGRGTILSGEIGFGEDQVAPVFWQSGGTAYNSSEGYSFNVGGFDIDSGGNWFVFNNNYSSASSSGDKSTFGTALWKSINGPGKPVFVGFVQDADNSEFYYTITGMAFDGSDNLYAIGTVIDLNPYSGTSAPSPAGPYVIKINASTGVASRLHLLTGVTNVIALAFNGSGTLYGVDDSNRLVTINPAISSGQATVIAALSASGIEAIAFQGGQLYGTNGSNLYLIDPVTAACTDLGPTGVTDLEDLASDPTDPDNLWTMTNHYTRSADNWTVPPTSQQQRRENQPMQIPLNYASKLLVGDRTGGIDGVLPLIDDTDSDLAYQNIHALAFNGSDLYGVGTVVDTDFSDGTDDALAGTYIIKIDPDTGLVTCLGLLNGGVTDLSAIAFNSVGTMYAVDPGADNLCTVNPITGNVTVVGAVPDNTVGLQFLTIGANEVLFGLVQPSSGGGQLYAIDPASGASTLLGDINFDYATGLAYDTTEQDYLPTGPDYTIGPVYLWTNSNGGSYVMGNIPLTSVLTESDRGTILLDAGGHPVRIRLVDSAEPAFTYDNITGMDFDSNGDLYGLAWIVNLDPVNVTLPADGAGPYLVSIDFDTGEVTRITRVDSSVSAMAFYDTTTHWANVDDLFGIVGDFGSYNASAASTSYTGVLATFRALAGDSNDFIYAITSSALYSNKTNPFQSSPSTNVLSNSLGPLRYIDEIDLDPSVVEVLFSNLKALAVQSPGNIYAVGNVTDTALTPPTPPRVPSSNPCLLQLTPTINGAGANVVSVVILGDLVYAGTSNPFVPTAIAFQGNRLFATDSTTNKLYVIDLYNYSGTLVDLQATAVATLDAPAPMKGISFINGYLFGVTSTDVYLIDPSTGKCTDLGPVGTSMVGLTTSTVNPEKLYTVDTSVPRISELSIAPQLVIIDKTNGSILKAEDLVDAYTGMPVFSITGMDFVDGVLYAICSYGLGFDKAAPGGFGWDGTVNSYAGSGSGNLDQFFLPSFTGVSKQVFYQIEPQFAQATPLSWVWPKGGLTSLSADPTQPGVFYTTDLIAGNKTLEDAYVLGQITLDGVDVGRLSIDGTLAGYIQTTGNIGQIAMGFLWGNIFIDKNLSSLTTYKGAGGFWPESDVFLTPPDGSLVRVGESLGMIDSRGGGNDYHFYTAVQVENKGLAPWPYSDIREIESIVGTDETDYKRYWDFLWRMGYLGYPDFDENDTIPNAQFLSSPDGNFTLTGSIHGYIVVPNVSGTGGSVAVQINYDYEDIIGPDYYALPLMAGQTFRMEGTIDPEVKIALLYPDGRVVDTFGFETVEDRGIGSEGTTLKAMTFTAPMAGIYYLQINYIITLNEYEKEDYKLVFTNATKANLGAINIIGDYGHVNSSAYGALTNYINPGDYASGTVAVENGGTLGAISITAGTLGLVVYAHGGGNIVDVSAATLGLSNNYYAGIDLIQSDGNIGRVASTGGDMIVRIEAGASGGIYNHDAYIQNVFAVGSFGNVIIEESHIPRVFMPTFISASGSIGVIDINGNFGVNTAAANQKSYIMIDSDGIGPAGKLDLLDIAGDWNYNSELRTGPAGVIGYVYIVGDIWKKDFSGWQAATGYVTVGTTSGDSTITTTSGTLTIHRSELFTPGATPTYTTASYRLLDVKNISGGLFASAIVNLVVQGPASLVADGQIYLSDVIATFTTVPGIDPVLTPPALVFGGNGGGDDRIDIYYISNLAAPATTPIRIANNTPGDLVAGDISGTTVRLDLNGSLGKLDGTVGEMLYGPLAPTAMTTPLYGLFNGTMNGLNVTVTGELNAWIGGSVGDLNVTGRLHTLRVNADNTTNEGDWDGIAGVVHATTGIDYVWAGDGLADDGGALLPEAGLFSEGAIYYVGITGPRREVTVPIDASIDQRLRGAVVYGELNGVIIGAANGTLYTDASGNPVYSDNAQIDPVTRQLIPGKPIDAVTNVIGTNGATCTALILSLNTFNAFQAMFSESSITSGGIGTVSFTGMDQATGQKSVIDGSMISSVYIRNVYTDASSNGIRNSTILGYSAVTGSNGATILPVGVVTAGGPGLYNCEIGCETDNIGTIRGLGSVADISYCTITAPSALQSISARNFINNEFNVSNYIQSFTATGDVVGTSSGSQAFYVGDIGRFSVGGDFFQNYMIVGGNVDSMNIKGDFDDSTLILNSRSADLKSLIVGGNISGTIISYGHIGTIMSQNGRITADVSTVAGGLNNDVELIQTAGGFEGKLTVGGSLKKFISRASLGTNPEDSLTGRSQTFNIAGNLDYLAVIGTLGQTHLYANINVGGDFGTLDVDGTLYSDVTVNGSLKKLVLDGGLGGLLDMDGNGIPETAFGSLNIFGAIGSMKFNPNADIYADLSLGGSITSLTLKNADIHGNITSRYGTIGTISVTGGDITSIISAKYIGSVSVTNGQISGTVRASTGIGSLSAGALNGATISSGWNIGNVTVKGNVNNSFILAGYDVGADGVVGGGDDNPLTGEVHSGNINLLNIGGAMNRTIVAGGVDPGAISGNAYNDFMSLGDNVIADGVSSLFKITVKGPLGGGANWNAFLADTLIDQKFRSAVGAQALFSAGAVDTPGTGIDFGLGTAAGTRWTAADGLVFTLNSGLANYNSATGQLALVRTSAASRLTITNPGAAPVTIFITSSDDSYLGSLTVKGPVVVGNATVDGEIGTFQVGTAGAGAVWSLPGGVKKATVTTPGNAIIDAGYVNNWSMTSNFTGSFRAGSIGTFSVTNGNFSGLLSAVTNISSIRIGGEISGRVRAGGNLTSFQAGSMKGALVAAAGDLTTANVRGNMTNSWLFAGFDPGDGGYGYVLGETGNVAIDRFATPVGVQEDQATCGNIKSVSVGGNMTASSISAAIDPGADGYIGTSDDRVDGMGYISTVTVKGYITGNSATNQFYGIYSANGTPVVKAHGQPFQPNGNVSYGTMASAAGNLMVTDVEMNVNQLIITFNHGVDTSTIVLGDTLNLIVSKDMTFNPATDYTIIAADLKSTGGNPWVYDSSTYTLTLTVASVTGKKWGTWDKLSAKWGGYYQLTLAASTPGDVSDNRGLLLDGEFVGALPSGDGKAGGDFVYTLIRADMPDNFLDSLASEAVPLVVDSGPMTITSFIDKIADIDVYRFAAEAWQFLSVQYVGPRFWTEQLASFCIFLRDTQGTDNTTADDTFEAVSRIEFGGTGSLFQAVELPESGDYFVAIEWSGTEPGKTYQLKLDLASSDSKLVADLNGKTPNDAPIAYISNTIDQHNNHLGCNSPKQLVYVDFDGGTARLYTEYNQSINVSALDLSKLDSNLGGYEDVIINGNGVDVMGIMDNIISIYRNTPASEPLGSLTVARIDLNDAGDWAAYLAASSGLFFTTDDPATKGLDPTKDFTTVFIGRSDERPFDIPERTGVLGVTNETDISNMNKANNAIVFTDNYRNASFAGSVEARLNEYSVLLANTAAHELGHALGLNHHPTDGNHYMLQADDPDNNPATTDDSNRGVSLMAYASMSVYRSGLEQLGTADLARNKILESVYTSEFRIGQADHVTQLLWWLT